jgi:transcriptional regulator with XRE-family HTH domain
MSNFGERLRAVRKQLGKSQTEFAEMAGVVTGSQGGYERGAVEPTVGYLLKLAEFGVDMNFLLGSTGAPNPGEQQINELLVVLDKLSPTKQAIGFVMLRLLLEETEDSSRGAKHGAEILRVAHLVRQFLAMDSAGKEMVALAAKGSMADVPPM